MYFDDPLTELPSVLNDVAELMANAHAELGSEARAEVLNELHDCVLFERRQIHWWERLAVTTQLVDLVLHSGRRLSGLSCQHACEEFVIATDDRFRFVIRTATIQSVSGLSSRASNSEHRQLHCGLQTLSFAEQSRTVLQIELRSENFLRGNLGRLWRDSVDIETDSGITTVPFEAIEFIRMSS
jgi:hypothetical protein